MFYYNSIPDVKPLVNPIKHIGLLLDEDYALTIMAEPFSVLIWFANGTFYVQTFMFRGFELSEGTFNLDALITYLQANQHHNVYLLYKEILTNSPFNIIEEEQ